MKVCPRALSTLRGTYSPSQVAGQLKLIHALDSPSHAVALFGCGHRIPTGSLQLLALPGRVPPGPAAGLPAEQQLPCQTSLAATSAQLPSSSPKGTVNPPNPSFCKCLQSPCPRGSHLRTPTMTAEASLGVGGKYLPQIPRGVLRSI